MIVFIQIEREEKKGGEKIRLYIFSEPTSLSEHLSLRQPGSPLQLELLLLSFVFFFLGKLNYTTSRSARKAQRAAGLSEAAGAAPRAPSSSRAAAMQPARLKCLVMLTCQLTSHQPPLPGQLPLAPKKKNPPFAFFGGSLCSLRQFGD